jgi:subtilisin family serine protease
MVTFAFTIFMLGGSLARLSVAAGRAISITRRELPLVAEVHSGGDVTTRKITRREKLAAQSSKAPRALSRTEGAKVTSVDASLMLGGVPVHNYDQRQPAKGTDAARFIENGGNLADWVGDVPHIWIVELKPGVTKQQLSSVCEQIRQMRNNANCGFEGDPEKGIDEFTIFCTEQELADINRDHGYLFLLEEADTTVGIPPGEMAHGSELLDDGSLLEQSEQTTYWGLDRIDDRSGIDGSYDFTSGGAGCHVYVHDTGIRVSHSEFEGRAIPALDVSSGTATPCNGNPACAVDRQGHGSHCAGTIAGRTTGVAKRAFVHAVKVLDDNGSGQQSWGIDAMNWLATNAQHPAVMSASLSGPGTSQTTANAIGQLVNRGVTVVVAAGNNNQDACSFTPAGAPAAITVGAIQQGDRRASYSNFGSCVDVFAPGSNIRSLGHQGDTAYAILSGTSMACPHVSGAVAVLRASGTSAAAVEGLIISTATEGRVTDLRGTTNKLLYLAPGAASGTVAPAPPTLAPAPTPPPSPPCCSGCTTAFCSPGSGSCYNTQAKSYYVPCASTTTPRSGGTNISCVDEPGWSSSSGGQQYPCTGNVLSFNNNPTWCVRGV